MLESLDLWMDGYNMYNVTKIRWLASQSCQSIDESTKKEYQKPYKAQYSGTQKAKNNEQEKTLITFPYSREKLKV